MTTYALQKHDGTQYVEFGAFIGRVPSLAHAQALGATPGDVVYADIEAGVFEYDGTTWHQVGAGSQQARPGQMLGGAARVGASVRATDNPSTQPPTNGSPGDLWVNTATGIGLVYAPDPANTGQFAWAVLGSATGGVGLHVQDSTDPLTGAADGDWYFDRDTFTLGRVDAQSGQPVRDMLLDEATIRGWIAQGALFEGTVMDVGSTVQGAIAVDTLPTPDPTLTGHYWIAIEDIPTASYTGPDAHPGDWIMCDGTQWVVIPGGTLTKSQADDLYASIGTLKLVRSAASGGASEAWEVTSTSVFDDLVVPVGGYLMLANPIWLDNTGVFDPAVNEWQDTSGNVLNTGSTTRAAGTLLRKTATNVVQEISVPGTGGGESALIFHEKTNNAAPGYVSRIDFDWTLYDVAKVQINIRHSGLDLNTDSGRITPTGVQMSFDGDVRKFELNGTQWFAGAGSIAGCINFEFGPATSAQHRRPYSWQIWSSISGAHTSSGMHDAGAPAWLDVKTPANGQITIDVWAWKEKP